MYPATISLRTKINVEGTDTEKKLGNFLFDETIQVLSSFELNSIASLTYNDETCDEIYELLTEVMAHAADHSILCVQKSLVTAKHLLIYGSERTVRSSVALTDFVRALSEFNTVLAAQQKNGVNSWWNSIKGGAVDKGFPVREAASKLLELLVNEPKVRQLRNNKADPNSLVPVGDDKVAFVSDEVRLFMLKKRMDEQNMIRVRSNLAKSSGGFGAGYTSKDGKTIVGAAHSIEEMMQRAEREKKSYSDSGPIYYKPEQPKFEAAPRAPAATMDLLDFSAPAPVVVPAPVAVKPEVDLLGFGGPAAPAPAPMDPFAPVASVQHDFLGGASSATPASTSTAQQSDLLGVSSSLVAQQSDLLGVTASGASPSVSMNSTIDAFAGLSMDPATSSAPLHPNPLDSAPPLPTEKPTGNGIMGAPVVEDRFAALDALELPNTAKTAGSILTGLEAQNRILSFSGISANEVDTGNSSVVPEPQQPPPDLPTPDLQAPTPTELPPDAPPPMPPTVPDMPPPMPPVMPEHTYGSATMNTPVQGTMGGMTMMSMMSGVNGLGGAPAPAPMPDLTPMPPPQPPVIDPSISLSAAEKYGDYNYDDDDDNGFVMGGTAGSGLDPTAAMPSQPPPPPPTFY